MKVTCRKGRWPVLSVVLLSLVAASYVWLMTTSGLILSLRGLQWLLPGQLTIGHIHGCLLGSVQVRQVHYRHAATELTIAAAQLSWRAKDLLSGQFTLDSLALDQLQLVVSPRPDAQTTVQSPSSSFALPSWLTHVHIKQLTLDQLILGYGDSRLTLHGTLAQQWHITWQLTLPNLQQWQPELQGCLTVQGLISGEHSTPIFSLSLPKMQLVWQGWQVQDLQGTFQVNSLATQPWRLQLQAAAVQRHHLTIKPLRLHWQGTLKPFSLQGTLAAFQLSQRSSTDQDPVSLTLPLSQLAVTSLPTGLSAMLLTTNQSPADQLRVDMQLPHYRPDRWPTRKQSVSARLQLRLTQLDYFTRFVPWIKQAQGQLTAQLTAYGPLLSPSLTAVVNLQHGSLAIPTLGLQLKKVTFAGHTEGKLLKGQGKLLSGAGLLAVQSNTLLDDPYFLTRIALTGKNVTLSDTQAYHIVASPRLEIIANTQQVTTKGFIFIPKAQISLNPNNDAFTELSSDVIFIDQEKTRRLPFSYQHHLRVQLGPQIHFNYKGLTTQVNGTLRIEQTAGHPALATGELRLYPGEYTYFGQSLQLAKRSKLTFINTPLSNPSLAIRADKKVYILPKANGEDTDFQRSTIGSTHFISSLFQTPGIDTTATVGIQVNGSLQRPTISLYADPPSAIGSDAEKLSYLVTGQPSNQVNNNKVKLFLSTLQNLGSHQSKLSQLLNQVQQTIKVDQISIGAKPIFNPKTNALQENTSIIIGKSFSSRLNIIYSLGIMDPINVLSINYKLNQYLFLQSTNSNFASGMDVFYTIEK